MNFSTLFGFSISIIVFVSSILLSLKDASFFLDFKSALIVVGGTMSATLICFPISKLFLLVKVFLRRMFGINKKNYLEIVEDVGILSAAYIVGKKNYEMSIARVRDPFLKDAAQVLFWLEEDVEAKDLRELMEQRANTHYERYMLEAKVFKTVAKFPPAFGLLGTTLGMIALLQTLGDANAKDQIGPAMSVALITTLYGVALSNMIFTPIAENLTQQTREEDIARRLVIEGIMLIERRMPTRFTVEKVKSFLLPSERGEGKAGAQATNLRSA